MKRIQNFLTRAIFYLLNKKSIDFVSLAWIDGYLPKVSNSGKITMGSDCIFRSFRTRHSITVNKGAILEIGCHVYINDGVNIYAAKKIKIGSYTKIGDLVYIYDTDFHQVTPDSSIKLQAIHIGRNVWIGARCMILAGSVIGNNAVIAAGSIVKGEIPANCVAAGNPIAVLKYFEASDEWIRK